MRVREKLVYEVLSEVAKAASCRRIARGKRVREDVRPIMPAERSEVAHVLRELCAALHAVRNRNGLLLREVCDVLAGELERRANKWADGAPALSLDEWLAEGGQSR